MCRISALFYAKVLLAGVLAGCCGGVCAQNEALVSSEDSKSLLEYVTGKRSEIDWAHMNIQFASSADVSFTDRRFEEGAFKVNRVRLEFLGAFGKKFSYHFRQALNQSSVMNASLENLSGTVELALMDWQLNDRLKLTVGKQAVQFSGYECWVNAIKVRYFSDFNNYLPAYQAGVNLAYLPHPDHEFNFQLANNRNGTVEEMYKYGLPEGVEETKLPVLGTVSWDGHFADRALQLRYSLSYGQLAKGKNVFYFTCGNVWDKKPFLAYLDFMYSREGIDSKGLVSELTAAGGQGMTVPSVDYFTTIANVDYRVASHWNLYAKGVYEIGNVYKSGAAVAAGNYRRTWNVQLCTEFFPMKNSELLLYLHLLYKRTHLSERARTWGAEGHDWQHISLGMVYTLPVF